MRGHPEMLSLSVTVQNLSWQRYKLERRVSPPSSENSRGKQLARTEIPQEHTGHRHDNRLTYDGRHCRDSLRDGLHLRNRSIRRPPNRTKDCDGEYQPRVRILSLKQQRRKPLR